ncbi:MAG: serine--tRNA ligase, partial [Jiangellaceae bacterium]
MLDLRVVRDQPDLVKASQRARGESIEVVDELISADVTRRSSLADFERLRAEQKSLGKEIQKASGEEKQALLGKAKELAASVKTTEAAAAEAQQRLDELALVPSNIIINGVPAGGEDDYVVLREVGTPPTLENPKDHLEIGESLRAIDTERGAKVSGTRFYFLTGVGAQLELGILNLAIQTATAAGFTPVITPTLVRPEIMGGTGFLGAHEPEVYRVEADDLYLVGTSEVALAGYHANEIVDLSHGPLRYAGWSACFRREAGSYGKDTRGIIRVHQFQKVEMFSYCREEDAAAEHERLLGWEEQMLAAVEVPYRVIDTAAGDLGASAARKYDCEAWLPSQ